MLRKETGYRTTGSKNRAGSIAQFPMETIKNILCIFHQNHSLPPPEAFKSPREPDCKPLQSKPLKIHTLKFEVHCE